MPLAKVLETFHVAATGVTYHKGKEVDIPQELFNKYDGRRFKAVKPEKAKSEPVAPKPGETADKGK